MSSFSAVSADIFDSNETITRQDILRGSKTPERAWWDLSHYDLQVKVDPKTKTISGTNTVSYRVLSAQKRLQIELQAPMQLNKVLQNGQGVSHRKRRL